MKRSFKLLKNMRNFYMVTCLLLSGVFLFSFKISKKDRTRNQTLIGVWANEHTAAPNIPADIRVFEENGSYYNIGFENGGTVMTHKGLYKVLDGENYTEKVIKARFNGSWDLQGNEFSNKYELSKDQQQLILRGKVYSKNGKDSLLWTEHYKRVLIP